MSSIQVSDKALNQSTKVSPQSNLCFLKVVAHMAAVAHTLLEGMTRCVPPVPTQAAIVHTCQQNAAVKLLCQPSLPPFRTSVMLLCALNRQPVYCVYCSSSPNNATCYSWWCRAYHHSGRVATHCRQFTAGISTVVVAQVFQTESGCMQQCHRFWGPAATVADMLW